MYLAAHFDDGHSLPYHSTRKREKATKQDGRKCGCHLNRKRKSFNPFLSSEKVEFQSFFFFYFFLFLVFDFHSCAPISILNNRGSTKQNMFFVLVSLQSLSLSHVFFIMNQLPFKCV